MPQPTVMLSLLQRLRQKGYFLKMMKMMMRVATKVSAYNFCFIEVVLREHIINDSLDEVLIKFDFEANSITYYNSQGHYYIES